MVRQRTATIFGNEGIVKILLYCLLIVFGFAARDCSDYNGPIWGPGDEAASLFHVGQMVRVYAPSGLLLVVGKVEYNALPYITMRVVAANKLSGRWHKAQQIVIDTRGAYLLATANQPNIKWGDK